MHQLRDCTAQVLIVDREGYNLASPLFSQLDDLKQVILLDEIEHLKSETDRPIISYSQLAESDAELPDVSVTPDDLMSIVYTSGTTGQPKGCMLPHGYYLRVASVPDQVFNLKDDDIIFTALPLFHGAGRMMGVAAALRKGIPLVIEQVFRSNFLDRIIETESTVMFGVAAMGGILLAQPPSEKDRSHRMRAAMWAPADLDMEAKLDERFGFKVISQAYGQTECACSAFAKLGSPAQPGSAGRSAPDLTMKLVDDNDEEVAVGEVGEILFRPGYRNAMFHGYWRKPEDTLHTFRGLWYHTGDYGRMSEDGSLYFVDRKKDYLRRRGENISSLELEAAIVKHPSIAEVAVHAIPSELTEDEIKACIVLAEGESVSPAELIEYFGKNIPYFAVPRYVEIMEELPKNAMSRVMKPVLKERGVNEDTWDFEKMGLFISREKRRS